MKEFPSRVDVNDNSFFAPESMIEAIKAYCEKSGQAVPQIVGCGNMRGMVQRNCEI